MDLKVGDMVYVKDKGCIAHSHSDSQCCECDFSKPVEVLAIDPYGMSFPISVDVGDGNTCIFEPSQLRKV